MPEFEELPFDVRPDLSPYIVHLTKNTKSEDNYSAYDNLVSILKTGKIWASDTKKGFIKGPNKATCFMDIPLSSLKYVLTQENSNLQNPRYEPFGVIFTKKLAYKKGCRPVLYLSNNEMTKLKIPLEERWRVVRLEVNSGNWISWMHEREWRCMGDFILPKEPLSVLVKKTHHAMKLQNAIEESPRDFKIKPKSIIPLSILCQGLPYM